MRTVNNNFPLKYMLILIFLKFLHTKFEPKYLVLSGTIYLDKAYKNISGHGLVNNVNLYDKKTRKNNVFKTLFIKRNINEALFKNQEHQSLTGYFIVRKRFFLNFIFAYVETSGKKVFFEKDLIYPYSTFQKWLITIGLLLPAFIIGYLGSDEAYIRNDISGDTFYLGMTAIIILLYLWIINISTYRNFEYQQELKLIDSVITEGETND